MQFDVSVEAKFHFTPTMEQVDLLIGMAKRHYDATCRAMAGDYNLFTASDGTAGTLTTWKRILESYNGEMPTDYRVITATSRQLDILLKVMEASIGLSNEQKEMRDELADAFICVLNAMQPKYKEWKLSVDSDK